jgi:hypothetical protein
MNEPHVLSKTVVKGWARFAWFERDTVLFAFPTVAFLTLFAVSTIWGWAAVFVFVPGALAYALGAIAILFFVSIHDVSQQLNFRSPILRPLSFSLARLWRVTAVSPRQNLLIRSMRWDVACLTAILLLSIATRVASMRGGLIIGLLLSLTVFEIVHFSLERQRSYFWFYDMIGLGPQGFVSRNTYLAIFVALLIGGASLLLGAPRVVAVSFSFAPVFALTASLLGGTTLPVYARMIFLICVFVCAALASVHIALPGLLLFVIARVMPGMQRQAVLMFYEERFRQ